MTFTSNSDIFGSLPNFMTVKQLQDIFSLSHATAYRLVRNGEIPSIRIGNSLRIPKQSLIDSITKGCYDDGATASGHNVKEV